MAFALSEASNMPAMLQLRIRACHVRGSSRAATTWRRRCRTRHLMDDPAAFDYGKLAHPPVTFRQEKLKSDERIPAARRYIVEHELNERLVPARRGDLGLIVQGGLYNSLIRALQQFGLADAFGDSSMCAILALNVIYPLVPDEIADFCRGKRAVLCSRRGSPSSSSRRSSRRCAGRTSTRRSLGKDVLPMAGEYTVETIARGLAAFLARVRARS